MELIYYVSIIAQFLTYASFLSGAKVCHVIHQNKSCAKFSAAPFLAGVTSTALWLRYGFVADEWEIVVVNIVGLACQSIYLSFFIAYSSHRPRLMKQLTGIMLFLFTVFWLINISEDPKLIAGSVASVISLIACASPLATIQDVFKTKCVASLPFPIIASTFLVCLSWLAFGYLKDDTFIFLTNLVAVSISGAQLSLFAIYPSTPAYEKLTQSNKKSYDLIRLLNSEDEDLELFDVDDGFSDEAIDTTLDYRETLSKVINQIYLKREQSSKKVQNPVLLMHSFLL